MKTILVVLTVILLSFSGCQRSNSNVASGTVVLEFYSWMDEEIYMTEIINVWNRANPDIQVRGRFFPAGDDYNQRLTISLSGGATVDIFCQAAPAGMAQFIEFGQVVDITDMMRRSNFNEHGISDFLDAFREEMGAVYGLPYRRSVWVLYYNKTLFDEAGIPYPENITWDEYTDIARRLTRGTGQNRIHGILNYAPTNGWWRVPANVNGANNPIIPAHLEEFRRAAQMSWDWSYVHNVQPPYSARTGTAGGDYIGAFLSGRYGMMVNGDWSVNLLNNGITAGANLVYDIAAMPHEAGREPYSTGVPTIAGITRSSRHPEEAFKFLTFMASREAAEIIARAGLLPAWTSPEINPIFSQNLTMPQNTDVFFTQRVQLQAPFDPLFNQAMGIVGQEMSLFLLLEQDIDRTFSTIARRIRDEVH